ncbi:MAG: right-handed parallel beta-helix repeat-containing protein, partial [Planctomycetota bacterium]|nr:right-handed parallel beta-helix repeat-containing protein [Planctomycetota bacterium]
MFLSSLKQRRRSIGFLAAVLALLSVPAISQAKTVAEVLRDNPGIVYLAESGKFYKFVNENFSWDRARSLAEATKLEGVNGRMLESRSAGEQAFILNNTKNFCWLGGTDVQQEGRWVWLSDGQQFSNGSRVLPGVYLNWSSGEPNDYAGNEDYVMTYDKAYRGGQWSDLRPNPSSAFVQYAVEWGATAVGVSTDYFVRKHGNDNNNGRSKGKAFRTIWRALRDAKAGSTVYVGAGRYFDELRAVHSGTSNAPIRFVADTDGTKTGDAGTVSTEGRIEIFDKHHIHFTGFALTRGGNGIQTRNATGIKIDQCNSFSNDRSFDIQSGSVVEITRTIIQANKYEGIRINGGTVNIVNCLAIRNGDTGIGVTNNGAQVTINHCTAAYNKDDGFDLDHGTATITNSIAAFNNDDGFDGHSATTHSYNLAFNNGDDDFEGISKSSSEMIADPKFRNGGGNDFRLQDGSPAIDKATGSEASDLAGNSRPFGPGRDIGCYEGGGGGGSGDYFVRRTGNDSNDGRSPAKAFVTIQKAASVASAGNSVFVGAGTYSEGTVHFDKGGTSSKPIAFFADTGGQKTGDAGVVTVNGRFEVGGAYVYFDGFEILGSSDGIKVKDNSIGCRVSACVIRNNNGHGVHLDKRTTATIINCLILNNRNEGVNVGDDCNATVLHCTIAYNGDDGVDSDDGTSTVQNCIIAFNDDGGIDSSGSGKVTHNYNLVYGNKKDFDGTSKHFTEIVADPRFVSSSDFHLQPASPAFDKGTDLGITVDLAGSSRPQGSGYDMGCYEGSGGGGGSTPQGDYYVRLSGRDSNDGKSRDTAFRTIARALAVVKAGELVYVGGGNYNEILKRGGLRASADKPVKFVADLTGQSTGDQGAVTTQSVYMWSSAQVSWNGFTFQGARDYAAYGEASTWSFENCTFSATGDGVRQRRGTATMETCAFKNCGAGVVAYEDAATVVKDSTFDNCSTAVYQERKTLTMSGCKINDSRNYGIQAKSAVVSLDGCELNRVRDGINLAGVTLTASNCSVSKASSWAFRLQGRGTITNTVVQDSTHGFYLSGPQQLGDIKLSGVKVKNITGQGLNLFRTDGDITSEGTQLAGDYNPAVWLYGCRVKISDGTVRSQSTGIYAKECTLDLDKININGAQQFALRGDRAIAKVTNCKIANSSQRGYGIYFGTFSSPTLENCSISQCGMAMATWGGGNTALTDCQIFDNYNALYFENGNADVKNSRIDNTNQLAFHHKIGTVNLSGVTMNKGRRGVNMVSSTATVDNVSISNMFGGWAVEWSNGKGTITNTVVQGATHGLKLSGKQQLGDIKLSGVKVKDIVLQGLNLYRTDGDITSEGTQLAGDYNPGAWLYGCRVKISDGTVSSQSTGIYAKECTLDLDKININGAQQFALRGDRATAKVTNCKIVNASQQGYGIYYGTYSSPTLENCSISQCGMAMATWGGGNTALTDCQIFDNYNALYFEYGNADVTNCRIDNTNDQAFFHKIGTVNLSGITMNKGRRGVNMVSSTATVDNVSISNMFGGWAVEWSDGRGTITNTVVQGATHGLKLSGKQQLGDIKLSGVKVKDIVLQGLNLYRTDGDITSEGTQLAGDYNPGAWLYGCRVKISDGTVRSQST